MSPHTKSNQPEKSFSQGLLAGDRIKFKRQFESELESLGGKLISCQEDELTNRLFDYLHESGIDAIQAWDESTLPNGLLADLSARRIKITQLADPELHAGLSGALAGIADTGTLVLPCDKERPATVSLLPETHLAILRESDIYPNLNQALHIPEIRNCPSAVLITGPSRTADIEMTLTIGVHGPGQVIVFCIHE